MTSKITDDDLRHLWAKHAPNIGGTLDYAREVYAIAYRQGLEDAANIVQANAQLCSTGSIFQMCLSSNAAAIRALMNEGA